MSKIHPSAIISKTAEIDDNVSIGPFCVVGPKVSIGNNCVLKNNVIIDGNTKIGKECKFYPFSVIGMIPQDLKYEGEDAKLKIGEFNVFREHSTVHIGTKLGGGTTVIGDHNLIMTGSHIAHDCLIGNNIILSHHVALAGHVKIDDHAILSAMVGVVQFRRIGKYAMIGGLCAVDTDVVPFSIASPKKSSRAYISGVNIIGMKRKGFKKQDIDLVKKIYKLIFNKNLTMDEKINKITSSGFSGNVFNEILNFIKKESKHGLCQPY